jgi:hypothetical protein
MMWSETESDSEAVFKVWKCMSHKSKSKKRKSKPSTRFVEFTISYNGRDVDIIDEVSIGETTDTSVDSRRGSHVLDRRERDAFERHLRANLCLEQNDDTKESSVIRHMSKDCSRMIRNSPEQKSYLDYLRESVHRIKSSEPLSVREMYYPDHYLVYVSEHSFRKLVLNFKVRLRLCKQPPLPDSLFWKQNRLQQLLDHTVHWLLVRITH